MKRALAATCAILALVISAEFALGLIGRPSAPAQTVPAVKNEPGTNEAVAPPPEFRLPGIARHAEVVERPLFIQGRRGTTATATATATGIENLILIGTIIMPDSRRALFHEKDGRTYRIVEGQSILGWRLAEVHPESAVLVNGPQQSTLPLRKYSKPNDPALPANPGTPPSAPVTPTASVTPTTSVTPTASDPAPAVTVDPAARAAKNAEREAKRAENETRRTGPGNGKDKKHKDR